MRTWMNYLAHIGYLQTSPEKELRKKTMHDWKKKLKQKKTKDRGEKPT
jgi:hypothetical protein